MDALPISAPPTLALGPRASSFRVQYRRTCRSVENENGGHPGMFANLVHRSKRESGSESWHTLPPGEDVVGQIAGKGNTDDHEGRQLNTARRKQHVPHFISPREILPPCAIPADTREFLRYPAISGDIQRALILTGLNSLHSKTVHSSLERFKTPVRVSMIMRVSFASTNFSMECAGRRRRRRKAGKWRGKNRTQNGSGRRDPLAQRSKN
ncbi:hypothetical protein C8F04DRAFT_1236296 [Mycena alexandri]|uniref:Uncharacterized protein n=1 Tax=Mycena alexandri TaxID=1745969 RepID=A0AAD6X3K2_9AGAR|nr:hypothetical protein C8F04DRAFT_1236296 [Mycena alexandri]